MLIKRLFDILVSLTALLVFSPILLVLILVIWRKLGWPVFFTQVRPGMGGRPFRLIKFRSMLDPTPERQSDAERLTAFGAKLRSTSLDELPELWNVLRGEMSLVGPRPLLMDYLPLYNTDQARRHDVRPGVTGWAQVNGRNALDWPQRFALDTWYVDNRSFWLDLKILVMTVGKVVAREGVTSANSVTAEPFRGNDDPQHEEATAPHD
jgi:lipopolysaccharide/colanic/teichoic acid biosynthesis glycosyltransferase